MNAADIAAGAHGLLIVGGHICIGTRHIGCFDKDYEYDAQHRLFDEQHFSSISRVLESRYVLKELSRFESVS